MLGGWTEWMSTRNVSARMASCFATRRVVMRISSMSRTTSPKMAHMPTTMVALSPKQTTITILVWSVSRLVSEMVSLA